MAYVRKTQTLIDDVANTVDSMMQAELGKRIKQTSFEIGTPLHDEVVNLALKVEWHEAPELMGKLPDSWCYPASHCRLKFDNGDDYNAIRVDLDTSENNRLMFPPKYDRWKDIVINQSDWTPLITKWITEKQKQLAENAETRDMFGDIKRQLEDFLGRHASLNSAIKEMPELKLYVPDEYISKLEQKTAPRSKTPTVSIVEELDIDIDNITRLAVAHRITKGE